MVLDKVESKDGILRPAPDSTFVSSYRLSSHAFKEILYEIIPLVRETSIPNLIKLTASLRFFAEGSYQRSVGKDTDIALGNSSVFEMLIVLENILCPKWIKLQMSEVDSRKAKPHFVQKFGIPGAIGTHVDTVNPFVNEHRKGVFSINAM